MQYNRLLQTSDEISQNYFRREDYRRYHINDDQGFLQNTKGNLPVPKKIPYYTPTTQMNQNTEIINKKNGKGTDVWGPQLWFSLHNGAANYPKNDYDINTQMRQLMKGWIKGLPLMIPCAECANHAFEYITRTERIGELDNAVKNRENLFKYFVDFHNHVNRKKNKREVSIEEAKRMYY